MEQNGSTSISQLPTSGDMINNSMNQQILNQPTSQPISQSVNQPISQSVNQNNIVLSKNEIIGERPPENNTQNNNYNEFVTQLQNISSTGITNLPSRDIPINTTNVNNDVEIKPNFIPQTNNNDYINNSETPEDLLDQNNDEEKKIDTLDMFYNEFQIPLLLATLYFLFQLPIFKKNIKNFMPFLFSNDGNLNLYGNIFNSVLFALLFYVLFKLINKITLSISI
tara:strand:+ start:3154 stop:3825 length:672 start_codon:yes stop_codon:yes gene_type:complete